MFPISEVSAVDMAFGGAGNIEKMMPRYEDIPVEFKCGQTKWNKFMNDWFYAGLKSHSLTPREGVDQTKALRHLKTIMGSFAPKHEHKEAAVAYLLDQWFSDGTWEAEPFDALK